MHNHTIKVENKIISAEILADIFQKMWERLSYYQKIYQQEYARNQQLDFSQKTWTFNDVGSKLDFQVDFYDNTYVKFDNYINFISVYNTRLHEIKSIEMRFALNYEIKQPGVPSNYIREHIYMIITEKKMDIDVALDSSDSKMEDIYKMIEQMVLNAPTKYDEVIKNKKKITAMVGFAIGFIPAIIITLIALFFAPIRNIFATTYVLYPIVTIGIAYFVGNIVSSSMLGKYYETISPDQVSAGWDSTNNKRIYKDDINSYVNSSEILIGKNINNLDYRKSIMNTYNKYKKWTLYEIGLVVIISIIVLFLK